MRDLAQEVRSTEGLPDGTGSRGCGEEIAASTTRGARRAAPREVACEDCGYGQVAKALVSVTAGAGGPG